MAYLYDVYDCHKKESLCKEKTAVQIEQLIGIKSQHVSYYVSSKMRYHKQYLITPAQNAQYTLSDWQKEWEDTTTALLTGRRIKKTAQTTLEPKMDSKMIKICKEWDKTRNIILKKLKNRSEIDAVTNQGNKG